MAMTRLIGKEQGPISCVLFFMFFLWSEGLQLSILRLSDKYSVLRIADVLLIVFLAIILIIGFLVVKRNPNIFLSNYYFKASIVLLVIVTLPTFSIGVVKYGESPISIFQNPMRFWAVLVIVYLISNNMKVVIVNRTVILISSLLISLQIFAAFFPNIGHEILTSNAYVAERFGDTRLTPLAAMRPPILYCMCFFFAAINNNRHGKKYLDIFLFFLFAYYVVFVAMSRKNIIGLAIIFLVYVFIKKGISRYALILVYAILAFICLELITDFYLIKFANNIFMSLYDETSQVAGNVGIRIYGIEYYWNLYKDTYYIGFGVGKSDTVLSGIEDFRYNLADQGIFATLFMFGIPSILFIFFTYKKIFHDLVFAISRHIESGDSDAYGLVVAEAIFMYFSYRLLIMSHVYFWHQSSIWWGVFFYMIYKIHDDAQREWKSGYC